jgi:hypothetical protein
MSDNYAKVRDIVNKHITTINGDIKSKGWLAEMVMDLVDFHPNRCQISLGKSLAFSFKDIARLTYKVPKCVAGYGVSLQEAEQALINTQVIGSDVPIFTRYNFPKLSAFVEQQTQNFFEAKKKNKALRLDSDYILGLADKATKEIPTKDNIVPVFVDLCLCKHGHTALELKSTADEDTSGARATLRERIITPFIVIPADREVYLGIVSNNKGYKQNDEWRGHLGGWLSAEHILVEEKLWDVIAPEDVSFDNFKEIVKARFSELVEIKKVGQHETET